MNVARFELVRSSYLGYPLEITDAGVRVHDKRGRLIAELGEISTARTFIRGYRRVPSNVELAATHARATASSNETEATP